MNTKVFNDLKAPLYILGHMVVAQSIFGNTFQVTSGVQSSGGTSQQMALFLANPSGSGINAVIDMVDMGNTSGTPSTFEMMFDGTPSSLTTVPIYNLNAGASHPSVCTAAAGGGPGVGIAGGRLIWTDFPDVAETYYPMATVLPPGHSLGITFSFTSSSNQGAFTVRWYEIPLAGGFSA